MATTAEEISFGGMTRIAGQSEVAAMDVESEAGKFRAYTSTIERASLLDGTNKSVTTAQLAMQVGGAPLANRRGVWIQNLGPAAIYIGKTGVSTATGLKVGAETSIFLQISEAQTVYAISAAGTQDVRVMEVS
jgi:hypothetical protein